MNRRIKLNKKGFMLAEVIVVSVVIVTVLVTLFTALNRLISAYDTRSTYYDIDAAYLAVEVNDMLVSNGYINEIIKNDNSGYLLDLLDQKVGYDIEDNILAEYSNATNNYIRIYLYIFSDEDSDEKNMDTLITNFPQVNTTVNTTNTFTNYINYLKEHIDFSEDYTYMIIVELVDKNSKDGSTNYYNDCKYYALKVR
ncbi:MAG: hypothetical protein ACI31S_03900 [Bacilli bacterium]